MSKKKRLAEYIEDDIRNMLKAGVYRIGDKLPNQTEFAKQLGVSRLSLREALQTLESMGIVEQRPKTGTIIKKTDFDGHIPDAVSKSRQDDANIEALRHLSEEQQEALERVFQKIHRGMYEAFEATDENKLREAVKRHTEYVVRLMELLFKKPTALSDRAGERYYP